MLREEQIKEIRQLLHKSQNPLFFFDNDIDGLASFLLLQRFIGRGKGVAIKSFPELSEGYVRKLYELRPDIVFVLDKPLIEKSFLDSASQLGIPVVWIDHHPLQNIEEVYGVYYFNPLQDKKPTSEPVAYWCQKIASKEEDLWIAMLGCIGDWFLPDFTEQFKKQWPGLLDAENAGDALYKSELGKISRILDFALKDRTSAVVKMLKWLATVKSPYELLEENDATKSIYKRFKQINAKYSKLLEKAKKFGKIKNKKVLFFSYGGDLSISGELANELFYLFPQKIVAVAYTKGSEAKISLRGAVDIRYLTEKAITNIHGRFGGHKNACAATIALEDVPKFIEQLEKESEKINKTK